MCIRDRAMFKQVNGEEFNVSKRTIASTKLSDNDKVIAVLPLSDATHAVSYTHLDVYKRQD